MFTRLLTTIVLSAAFLLASCSSFYGNVVNNQVKQLETLTAEMKQVNDKPTADALAPRLGEYGEAIGQVWEQFSTAGEPSTLELLRMRSQLKDDSTKAAASDFIGQVIRLRAVDFYGSQDLKNAYFNQVKALSGQ